MPSGEELIKFSSNINSKVLIGYPSGKQHTAGSNAQSDSETVELAELAKRLSFGDSSLPPRPFIENGLQSANEQLKQSVKKQVDNIQAGHGGNWGEVGTLAVGAVQALVRSDFYKSTAPNSPETIESKKSDTPLIDTGDLINSLTFVVERQ